MVRRQENCVKGSDPYVFRQKYIWKISKLLRDKESCILKLHVPDHPLTWSAMREMLCSSISLV